jgi:large subunit ribosomal protein L29
MADKKKKAEDLKGKTPDELKKDLMDLKKRQMNMRFQKSQGQLANTSEIRKTRRQIARVKTAMGATANATAKAGKKAAPKKAAAKKSGKKAA